MCGSWRNPRKRPTGPDRFFGGMIPKFLYPFLAYRSLLLPFLVVSAITVPCWLVFRLYRLRTSGQLLSFRREILLLTFVVYLSGLAAVTLISNNASSVRPETTAGINPLSVASLTCSSASLPKGSTARAFCVRNARGNFMLFFPLGVLIPLVWTRLRFWKSVLIVIAVSSSIELVQYLSRTWINRSADANDVVLNVLGAVLGLLLVSSLRQVRFVARDRASA